MWQHKIRPTVPKSMLGDVDKAKLIKATIGERPFPHAGHLGKCQKLIALPGESSLVN